MNKLIFPSILAVSLVACAEPRDSSQSAEEVRSAQVARQMEEATRQVPPPAITNFQQLRNQTFLYELMDQELVTHSYYTNLNGELIYICPSIGYGMNASIQITNPERVWMERDIVGGVTGSYNDVGGTVPQPEPNGLYMPEGLAATYVMCSDGQGGLRPMYVEDNIIVSPFPLAHSRSIWPGYESIGELEVQ